jgi:hypothetical protein
MPWPLSQDYNELIQNPQTSFADLELRGGRAVVNTLGIPIPRSGNFADVYEFYGASGSRWAIKCFTRQIPGLRERYREISQHLQEVRLPFMVDFTFLDRGIRVRSDWSPVIKMQWIDGLMLNQFVEQNLEQPQLLQFLCQLWVKLAQRLREVNLAHCDLQHGNVLLVPTGPANGQVLKLVDYDGMCVPALASRKSIEVGHPAYQHPQRLREGIYNLEVDRFSHLVIYTALRSLVVAGRQFWKRYDTGDNLLFRPEDFQAPNNSALFRELLQMPDLEVRRLAAALASAAQQPLDRAPLLADLGLGQRFVQTPPQATPVRQQTAPASPTPAVPVLEAPSIPVASAVAATVAADPRGLGYDQESKPRWPMWAAVGSAVGLVGVIFGIAVMASGTSSKLSESSPKTDASHKPVESDPKPKPSPENPRGEVPGQVNGSDKTPNLANTITEIRDGGGFFSAGAIEKANAEVRGIKSKFKKDLVIETFSELPENKKAGYERVARDQKASARFFDEWGRARAKELQLNGVYIAIFKTPAYLTVQIGGETQKKAFSPESVLTNRLHNLLAGKLRNKQYDDGLLEAIAKVHDAMEYSAAQSDVDRSASPDKQSEPRADTAQREPSNANPTQRTENPQADHKSSRGGDSPKDPKANNQPLKLAEIFSWEERWQAVKKEAAQTGNPIVIKEVEDKYLQELKQWDGKQVEGAGILANMRITTKRPPFRDILGGSTLTEQQKQQNKEAMETRTVVLQVAVNLGTDNYGQWDCEVLDPDDPELRKLVQNKPLYVRGVIKVPKRALFKETYLIDCKVFLKEASASSNSGSPKAKPESKPERDNRPKARNGKESAPAITVENIKKVQLGMTLDQVEQVLGKGKKATEDDVREAISQLEEDKKKMEESRKKAKDTGSFPDIALPKMDFRPGTTKYRWGTMNTWLFVDVDESTQKVVRTAVHSSW